LQIADFRFKNSKPRGGVRCSAGGGLGVGCQNPVGEGHRVRDFWFSLCSMPYLSCLYRAWSRGACRRMLHAIWPVHKEQVLWDYIRSQCGWRKRLYFF